MTHEVEGGLSTPINWSYYDQFYQILDYGPRPNSSRLGYHQRMKTRGAVKLALQEHLSTGAYNRLHQLLGPIRRKQRAEYATSRDAVSSRRSQIDSEVISILGGASICRGPFAGSTVLRESNWGFDVSSRLLGTYELELHETIEQLIKYSPSAVFDVGCAEGHYVVGFARRLPNVPIFGYDIDAASRDLARRSAVVNNVYQQVSINGEISSKDLIGLPERSLVIMDIEGAELYLLTDEVVASNPKSWFIIECHDAIRSDISKILTKRFSARNVRIIHGKVRKASDAPMIPAALAEEVLDEMRAAPAKWLIVL